ncbi:MAG TPA: hypothetical protein VHN37_15620 [Actinomycetota bacterium]|nr:hypothetical protein [Actinomycetota bacterium]
MRLTGRGSLAAGAVVALTASLVPPAVAQGGSCFGKTPTIVGTRARDHLFGTPGDDVIDGLGSHDWIEAGAGDDTICGSDGYDDIYGGPGDDSIDGGDDLDDSWGQDGADTILTGDAEYYRLGQDLAVGGPGDDSIDGDAGPNLLYGGPGDDVIRGHGAQFDDCDCETQFDEELHGGPGNDELTGGAIGGSNIWNQVFVPGPGDDDVDTGRLEEVPGSEDCGLLGDEPCLSMFGDRDVVRFYGSRAAVTVDLAAGTATGQGTDRIVGIDMVVGSRYDDVISGDDTQNVILGGDGFGYDTITGLGSNDYLIGGYGSDAIDAGAGAADEVDGGSGDDRCVAAEHRVSCEETS